MDINPYLWYTRDDFKAKKYYAKETKLLGKEDKQTSFFDTDFACSNLINKESFYAKMHDLSDKIISDNDFA